MFKANVAIVIGYTLGYSHNFIFMIQNLQIGYLHGVRVKICAKYAVNSSRKNVDGNTCRSYTFHSNTKKKFDFCVSYYYDSKCL